MIILTRNTIQRQIIFEALQQFETHPTVEEVYQKVHQSYPTISKVTVYRNLRLLAENGLVKKVMLPEDMERYDKRTDRHYHFKCRNCGALYDIDVDFPENMDEAVRSKYGFEVDEHDVVFNGLCSECRGG